MTEFLGLGVSPYVPLAGPDEQMADTLRYTLQDPDLPVAAKDPSWWTPTMRDEWTHDIVAAGEHRAALTSALRRCREALDAFSPDYVVVWGDGKSTSGAATAAPFCVRSYGDVRAAPFHERNAWDLSVDTRIMVRGAPAVGRSLVDDLKCEGFESAATEQALSSLPWAVLNAHIFLDYDHAGRKFPYPIVPITLDCYGQQAGRRGGRTRFAEIRDEEVADVAPSPWRCFELGASVARALRWADKRVALIASSSWSQAFLNDKDWHLHPDADADLRLYDDFAGSDFKSFADVTIEEVHDAGQHELLSWFCLAGAAAELDLSVDWSTLVTTEVFDSNKCFTILR